MGSEERVASSSRPKKAPKSKGRDQKVRDPAARRQRVDDELRALQQRVDGFVPPAEIDQFSQLPLSSRTLKGLKSSHFVTPTPIQSLAIPPALASRDVLGSASTGSGKTLAFLIPMLERLYLLKWGPMDGLGAVVISPTRELAVQTFNQLRDVGKYHNFSAGLVIGGKPLKEERDRLGRMNILIATPGRLLQHLDSTVGFESAGVKLLVLDEADRLLDMGFLPALRAIVGHFSSGVTGDRPDRQTLLFSATQSKDLAALAKLSLHDPLYINCNKPGEEGVMPSGLEQYYAVVNLDKKLDALWGFVKSHLKMKGVVFVTSGKQVRFIFETFRRLHPGLPLMHLHGKQKQPTRLSIFQKFSSSKSALLVCTDVAARGLDFPSVDWVVQLDCPEDADTYIHRVGRTARYQSQGKALMFLCPSEEEGMLQRSTGKGIDVKKIKIKSSKMGDLKQQMQNFAFKEPEIKYLGQRAFISYMRSVHLQKDKTIFKLSELPAEEYAASMGLPGAPQIKLAEGKKAARTRGGNAETKAEAAAVPDIAASSDEEDNEEAESDNEEDNEEAESDSEASDVEASHAPEDSEVGDSESESEAESSTARHRVPGVRTKYDRMFERTNQSILTPHYTALVKHDGSSSGEEEEDDVFTLARRDHALPDDPTADASLLPDVNAPVSTAAASTSAIPLSAEDMSKRKLKAAASRKGQVKSRPGAEKVLFDESGAPTTFYEAGQEAEVGAGAIEKRREHVESEKERMKIAHEEDRKVAREKKMEKKRKRKERERELRDLEGGVEIGGGDYSDGDDDGTTFGSEPVDEPVSEPERAPERKKGKKVKVARTVEDEEELALRLLQGGL